MFNHHKVEIDWGGRPLILDRLCGEMPGLKVIAGHGGWPWVPEMVAAAWRHPNLYIDPSGHRWKYLATPNSGWEMLLHFGGSVLQDKILFGSDYPGWSPGQCLDELEMLGLKPGVADKIFTQNALRVLKLEDSVKKATEAAEKLEGR